MWEKGTFCQRMQIKAPGKREGEGASGPHTAPSHSGHEAAQLCQSPMGHGAPTPTAPPGNDQFHSSTDGSVKPVCAPGTAGTTPWERDPWVALAMKVGNHPPIVWGVCCLHNNPGDSAIRLPFLIDTGSDVTVIPETYWPIHWELEEAPMVGGVGGLSRAQKSTQLIAITLRTERGPEKTITLFPYVMPKCPPLLGRDALALLKVRVTNLV